MALIEIRQQRMLKKLLRRPDIWRGESMYKSPEHFARKQCLKTGFTALDNALVQQGWPLGGLIEVSQGDLGAGEWQLLAPALRDLKQIPGYLVLINPSEIPYAPGLSALGLNLKEIMIITPKNRNDAVAAFVEALRNSACKALLFWENQIRLKPQEMRRLQLAAAKSQTLCFLFRHTNALRHNSPALLRLHIQMDAQQIHVQLLKQRGRFKYKETYLDVPEAWQELPALSSNAWLEINKTLLPEAHILPFRKRQ